MCYMHRYKKLLFGVQYLELTARASYATILSLSDHVHMHEYVLKSCRTHTKFTTRATDPLRTSLAGSA